MPVVKGSPRKSRKTRERENPGPKRVAGLVLAAGASSRMGGPKQLLPFGEGTTLLGRVLNQALDSNLSRIALVLGHEAGPIKEALGPILAHPKLVVVCNPRYRQGISSSIIAGLSKVEETHDHVMILLADMPHITSKLINLFLRRYLDSKLPLGAVSVKGRRSHPVIFSRRFYRELHGLEGDVGAREIFDAQAGCTCLVEVDGIYDDRDIDTPEDYLGFVSPI
jgi:molybdenum cofactor cytidylyltransferase